MSRLESTERSDLMPSAVLSLPEDSEFKLHRIVMKHRLYVLAKAEGKLATDQSVLTGLHDHLESKTKGVCSLCLEDFQAKDKTISLPCGHSFHAGSLSLEHDSKKKKRKHEDCSGITYWLKSNNSCPECRHELPSIYKKPSESESVLVPMIHRQNRIITRQAEQIKELTKKLEKKSKRRKKLTLIESQSESPFTWQQISSASQKSLRQQILEEITKITSRDIIIRGEMNSTCKEEKIKELSIKIEFILYCYSTSLEKYSDLSTLRERTLDTVKDLAAKARALKDET